MQDASESATTTGDEASSQSEAEADSSPDTCDPNDTSLGWLHRYELDGPTQLISASGRDNFSGVAFDTARASYWVVLDVGSGDRLIELDAELSEPLREFGIESATDDFEGIAALGDGEFALVNENNRLLIIDVQDASNNVGQNAQVLQFAGEPNTVNQGAEAVAFDASRGTRGWFWVALEKNPVAVLGFARPDDELDHEFPGGLEIDVIFDETQLGIDEIAGATFDPRSGYLWVLSQEHNLILELDVDCRRIIDRFDLPAQSMGLAPKWEALTIGRDQRVLIGGESNGAAFNRVQWLKLRED